MAFKIYTKTGDKGETGLFGGARIPKNDIRIEAYGTVDELNSFVGNLVDLCDTQDLLQYMTGIQDELFVIGSHLARDPRKPDLPLPSLPLEAIERLESGMDRMDEQLEPLKSFILPGGHPSVSAAHICRTVCRRAERRVIDLAQQQQVDPWIIQYLNRLSDYFFIIARYLAKHHGVADRPWNPKS